MKHFVFATCFGILSLGSLSAQETSHFSFEASAGWTQTVGNTGRYLDNGWNVGAGVGYSFSSYIGVLGEAGYTSLGVNSTTLTGLGYPGGDINVFSATIDPIVHLTPKGHFDLYAIGGGGLYRWAQSFSSPSGAVTSFNTGSFPLTIPDTGNEYSVNKPGFNAGMGVAFGTKWHGKIFAEARYVHVFLNNNERGDYVPVSFGYRW